MIKQESIHVVDVWSLEYPILAPLEVSDRAADDSPLRRTREGFGISITRFESGWTQLVCLEVWIIVFETGHPKAWNILEDRHRQDRVRAKVVAKATVGFQQPFGSIWSSCFYSYLRQGFYAALFGQPVLSMVARPVYLGICIYRIHFRQSIYASLLFSW